MNQAVLAALTGVLDERGFVTAIDRALTRLRTEESGCLDWRQAVEQEVAVIEAQERRIVDAIARGSGTAVELLLARLTAEGERKQVLLQKLQSLRPGPVRPLGHADLDRELRVRPADVEAFFGRTRSMRVSFSRSCSPARWIFTPVDISGRRTYPLPRHGKLRWAAGKDVATCGGGPNGPRDALTEAFTFQIEGIALTA